MWLSAGDVSRGQAVVHEIEVSGGNHNLIYVDFMIGSSAMDVDGLTEGGVSESLMRGGEWALVP